MFDIISLTEPQPPLNLPPHGTFPFVLETKLSQPPPHSVPLTLIYGPLRRETSILTEVKTKNVGITRNVTCLYRLNAKNSCRE